MKYTISFYAPFNTLNFVCEADTVAEARAAHIQAHGSGVQAIGRNDVRSEKFGRRNVNPNGTIS